MFLCRLPIRRLSPLVAVVAFAAALVAPTAAQANGCINPAAGTSLDPFLIATPGNLDCLVGNDSYYWGHGYHFRQTADLDMSSYAAWTRGIGSAAIPFDGTYDGHGFTISNLTVSSSGSGVGLFGVTTGATLKNITMTDLQVTGERQVGGLVGVLDGGSIEEAAVDATVTGACSNPGFNCYVGGLVGQVDDSAATTIARSWTSGSATAPAYGRGAGGLIGGATPSTLTVTDSYSTAAVTGYDYVGGLIGVYVEYTGTEVLSITDSYARGAVGATGGSSDHGGLLGCLFDFIVDYECAASGSANVTDTFWDTQTTGQATTAANRGRGKTTAQMTDRATFGNWSIDDTTPNLSTTWGICTALNSGYPFLQWYAEQESWTCTPPAPPDPTPVPAPAQYPPSEPTGVVAVPGRSAATVSWRAPVDPGSYPVTSYEATASPGGLSCAVAAPALSCTVTGLTDGTPYAFRVRARNDVGWGLPSSPSAAVTPGVVPGAPAAVMATAGDASAAVSWTPPADVGAPPATEYEAVASPGGATCTVSVPATTCEIVGLANGTAYTVTVRGRNAIGWSPASAPSAAFTPAAPSILITGSRDAARPRYVLVAGTTTGLVGQQVTPWVRFPGEASYTAGAGVQTVQPDGTFAWTRKSSRKTYVYFTHDSVKSNTVTIPAR